MRIMNPSEYIFIPHQYIVKIGMRITCINVKIYLEYFSYVHVESLSRTPCQLEYLSLESTILFGQHFLYYYMESFSRGNDKKFLAMKKIPSTD